MKNTQKLTIFIVSNQSGKLRKLVIPTSWIKGGIFFTSLFIFIFLAGFFDYFGLILQTVENKRLRMENELLSSQIQVIEGKVTTLEEALERVKTFTTKLKLITNMDEPERATQLTMNPKPVPGETLTEYEPLEERPEADQLVKNSPPPQEPPLNSQKREIASIEKEPTYSHLVLRIDQAVKEVQLKEQSVTDLWEYLSERQAFLKSVPNIKPARGWLSSSFGYRISPIFGKSALHAGIDIAANPGAPVIAPADGMVIFAGYDDSYGKLISIDHGFGVTTRYGHLSKIHVQLGQKISKTEVIGAVGNTGRSTGPHLHYEVRVNNAPVDPQNYILDE